MEKGRTFLYSHRKPERGMAISFKGQLMTRSINAFTLGGCNYHMANN